MTFRESLYIAGKLLKPINLKGMLRFIGRIRSPLALLSIGLFNRSGRVRIRFEGRLFTFDSVSLENLSSLYEIFGKEVYRMDVPARTILDLGGYQGYYTCYAYAKYPEAIIYTFEPLPENFSAIRRNLAVNQLDPQRIRLGDAAVSDRVGTTTFYVSATSGMGSSAVYKGDQPIDVPTITIPEIRKRHGIDRINILKIDIEGSEYAVFKALDDAELSKIETIVAELHPVDGERIPDLIRLLESKGLALKSPDEVGREYLFSRKT